MKQPLDENEITKENRINEFLDEWGELMLILFVLSIVITVGLMGGFA